MTATFPSVSAALGYAAAVVLARGRMRKPSLAHGGPPPDEWAAVAVLQAMRSAGCPYESPAGQALLAWATAPDDVGQLVDSAARSRLSVELERIGLVVPPRDVEPWGWRVHEQPDGRPLVTRVEVAAEGDVQAATGPAAVKLARALGLVRPLLSAAPAVRTREDVLAEGRERRGRRERGVVRWVAAELSVTTRRAQQLLAAPA